MALSITINKVVVADSFAAGTKVADIVVSGGTSPYSYSLASGGDYFQIEETEVRVIADMNIDNIQSFSVFAEDSTSGEPVSGVSEEVYPNIAAKIQSRFNSPNKIYKITQDIDLGHGVLTIPSGCTLDFQGGSFSNGTIIGNKTNIVDTHEFIFNNIELKESFNIKGWYPEWFGAIPYKKNIINKITGSISIKENIKESNNAFITINNVLINTNVHTVLLNNLYYITNGIDICITEYYDTGVTFIGNGTDTGFIVQMNNNDATALSINNNKNNTISQSDYLFNFAIYITNNSNLKSALSLYNTIRSTCRDIKIYGGYANFQKGLFHIHSAKNQNVFQNIFDGCAGLNTTTGGGLHYSQDTYQPTLQSISNCVFASLGGAGIESEPTDITGGGFGGIITANELEGNAKGAIAISSVYNLSVTNNYFEFADYSDITNNYFENVPPAIFTFGIISSSDRGYITNVYNLTISNNQLGSPKGSIKYAFIFNSSVTGGRTFNVRIINNIINNNISDNNGCKYITKIQHCKNVVISNNQFIVNYSDVNPDFPIELTTNGEVYYENNNSIITYGNYNYSYSKGTAILRTNAFTTVNNYPYLIPVNQSKENIVDSGDFIFLEHNNTIYKVIQGGKLHYNTNASFVENSNVVTCSGAVWNWSIGDTVNSEYINNRTAVITSIDGNSITLSENAIATINDWLTDAIIIPYELSSSIKTNGSSSSRPTYKNSKITIGFQYFDTTLNKPIWWTGAKWVDATGTDV